MKENNLKKARLLDPAFVYTPASQTDIRKTFARIRRELEFAAKVVKASNVKPLKKEVSRA